MPNDGQFLSILNINTPFAFKYLDMTKQHLDDENFYKAF